MSNFHDPEYDGIVLKIPSWFIPMNELEPALKAFREALEKSNKSMFYLDHKKNLYELEHMSDKKKVVEGIRAKVNEERKRAEDEKEALIKGDFYKLFWNRERCLFDSAYDVNITFPDGRDFDSDEIFTKRGVKASFEKDFRNNIKTFKDLCDLYYKNSRNVDLGILIENCDESFITMDYSLFYSNQGWDMLGISISRLTIAHDWRKSKNGYSYKTAYLKKFEDGALGYTIGNSEVRLDGFEKKHLTLIKK